jgi:hypothetical protein
VTASYSRAFDAVAGAIRSDAPRLAVKSAGMGARQVRRHKTYQVINSACQYR